MTTVGRAFLLFLGGLFAFVIVVGGFSIARSRSIVSTYARAQGVIVHIDEQTGNDGDPHYRALIEYSADDGTKWRFPSAIATSTPPDVESVVEVLYDPADPGDAVENTFAALWLVPLVLLPIGVVGLVAVVIVGAFMNRRRRKALAQLGSITERNSETVTATFSHVQPRRPDAEGRFQYRVVAVRRIGGIRHTYQSEWLDENPTVAIMAAGNELPVRLDADGTGVVVVDQHP